LGGRMEGIPGADGAGGSPLTGVSIGELCKKIARSEITTRWLVGLTLKISAGELNFKRILSLNTASTFDPFLWPRNR
jgi:hypothetical protein